MAAYLAPVEKPRGLMLKMISFFTRRQFGKVMGPITLRAGCGCGSFISGWLGAAGRLLRGRGPASPGRRCCR